MHLQEVLQQGALLQQGVHLAEVVLEVLLQEAQLHQEEGDKKLKLTKHYKQTFV
jgi:hypothetical protein